MPYSIEKQGDQHCVYNTETGETVPGGCHDSKQDAVDHLAALESNVEDAGRTLKIRVRRVKRRRQDARNRTA